MTEELFEEEHHSRKKTHAWPLPYFAFSFLLLPECLAASFGEYTLDIHASVFVSRRHPSSGSRLEFFNLERRQGKSLCDPQLFKAS